MQAANPPPAETDAPPLPDELLRRLQEHYASASPQRQTPTLWGRVRGQISSSNLIALAACLLLLGVVANMGLQEDSAEDPFGVMRGLPDQEKTVAAYWLSDNDTMAAPTGPLMPKLIIIPRSGDLPTSGTIMVFDSAKKEARLVENGQTKATTAIYDAAESEDWISARRQLLNTLKP